MLFVDYLFAVKNTDRCGKEQRSFSLLRPAVRKEVDQQKEKGKESRLLAVTNSRVEFEKVK